MNNLCAWILYLSQFSYASANDEEQFLNYVRRSCYDTFYPFGILMKNQLRVVDFEPITIFYGGNGSGKSTALNIIAEKLGLERDTLYNRTDFYEKYLRYCDYEVDLWVKREKLWGRACEKSGFRLCHV